MRVRSFGALTCKKVEPGLRRYYDVYELVCVDLLRLRLRLDTAWLHILGSSPWLMDAFQLLLSAGRATELNWITSLLLEGERMPALQTALVSPELLAERRYVVKSWELAKITHSERLQQLIMRAATGTAEEVLELAERMTLELPST